MNNSEAAKNLLNGKNCYECGHYFHALNQCLITRKELPQILYCNEFFAYNIIDVEEELIQSAMSEMQNAIDENVLEKISGDR